MSQANTQKEEVEEDNAQDEHYADDCTLFVGDLHRSIAENQLLQHFKSMNGVVSASIKRDKYTNYSLGYGFVQFETRELAAKAKAQLHRSSLGNRAIRIGWAQKNTNIFVSDLDPSVSTEVLREAFSKFGPLCEDDTYVRHKVYGFVKFKHRQDAEEAKRSLDGTVLAGVPIRVGWGETTTQRYCVNIQFNPKEAESNGLTEQDLQRAFAEFGQISSVSFPADRGRLKGFGFVYYEENDDGEEAAQNAISALSNSKIHNTAIKCRFGKKMPNRKRQKRRPRDNYAGPYYGRGGNNWNSYSPAIPHSYGYPPGSPSHDQTSSNLYQQGLAQSSNMGHVPMMMMPGLGYPQNPAAMAQAQFMFAQQQHVQQEQHAPQQQYDMQGYSGIEEGQFGQTSGGGQPDMQAITDRMTQM